MTVDLALYALAGIGAVVVAAATVIVGWLAVGVALVKFEAAVQWVETQLFYAAGGEADERGTGQVPRPPFDRLWVELRWVASATKWVQTKLGYASYVNPGERPDLERLYELRKADHGQGRWGWLPDWARFRGGGA